MFHAISWFLSSALLALWSLACWGLHAAAAWTVSGAGALSRGAPAMNAALVPDWLRGWLPPELAAQFGSLIASAGSMVQSALEFVPALSGTITGLAWALWGLGAVAIVALAVLAHVLIALLQRRSRRSHSPGTSGAAIAR